MFSFAYCYLLLLLIVPSNYKVNTPGELTNLNDVYSIEGYESNNSISSVSVYSWSRLTNLQKWLVTNNNRFNLSEKTAIDNSLSHKDIILQGQISRNSSLKSAVITAYNFANLEDENIIVNYYLNGLDVYLTNYEGLIIGDKIVEINGINILDNNYLSYEDFLRDLNLYDNEYPNYLHSNNLEIKLLGSNELIKVSSNYTIIVYPDFEITSTTPKIDWQTRANEGGPSGGFMQTVAIYTKLLNIDLKGKIAGTGTMTANNVASVGAIGGLVQKYYTVKEAKVNYFLVPKVHEGELDEVIKAKDQVIVYYVESFADFIENYLPLLKEVN